MPEAKTTVSLWNPANLLTMLRLALVPIFVVLLWHNSPTSRWGAAAIFAVAAATDKFDGDLARKYGWITNFGKLADPIADKALVMSALVLLTWQGVLWWWVAPVIIVRELGITVLRLSLARVEVIAANNLGKLKTVTQMLFIQLALIPWSTFLSPGAVGRVQVVIEVLVVIAVVLTVWSGVGYIWGARQSLRARN
ncbi:CDP-diacylglycerol--glycerol-3-phosphate 3-phosphatidyltransferase [Buchananella hordeovulneris]|uniref:CDP-diacylglycerol--glycerol-3-phosphate 3-phosphatidyltransferase n=1 Tax=Buchananella hordeovulneris TaxID=52770 RepID=UPI000F5DC30C|nr:CDP-diacylglycerol--glycerol-3-phosphate 3-phosphatidyltransferase [Buchananella hordeovulneris]RRD44046.1 CDP-diacylglycerol--glycerol-3-phosphate 3-phosphatidyltransferase [Buchananella hordeovulneris]